MFWMWPQWTLDRFEMIILSTSRCKDIREGCLRERTPRLRSHLDPPVVNIYHPKLIFHSALDYAPRATMFLHSSFAQKSSWWNCLLQWWSMMFGGPGPSDRIHAHKCNQLLVTMCSNLIVSRTYLFILQMLLSPDRMTAGTGQAGSSGLSGFGDTFALYQWKVRGFKPIILALGTEQSEPLAWRRLHTTICPSPTYPFNSESML